MKTKIMGHTAGPWRAEKFCIWAGDKYIAGTQTGIAEQEANARLIAAAPDLLIALEMALDRFTDNDMIPPNYALSRWIDRARAAISKAKGE